MTKTELHKNNFSSTEDAFSEIVNAVVGQHIGKATQIIYSLSTKDLDYFNEWLMTDSVCDMYSSIIRENVLYLLPNK